ncbi:MAG: hypothetical protein HY300_01085 [Verrucomicrobia bacterium]|nr:hypothetical protein [Verrucomicrobiota bacterium]
MTPKISWPDGKTFAFSVFDDTDAGTVENLKPVYDHLLANGIRTTKSVWALPGTEPPAVVGGLTCDDPAYVKWLLELQKAGVEIGWHNATYHSSRREQTRRGLERFKELFGDYPRSMANHTTCQEGIYWGENRVTGLNRTFYNLLTRGSGKGWFRGHVEDDEFFWGDLCKAHIRYVRNFVFGEINTLKCCPWMPYSDASRPFANAFYASSEGGRVEPFVKTISEASQDRLEAEGGCCIMYTHFAKGFFRDGKLSARFESLIERLGKKNGWFVPVTELLDYIAKARGGVHALTTSERAALERRWLWHKIFVGTT